jgi:hypothetical protein
VAGVGAVRQRLAGVATLALGGRRCVQMGETYVCVGGGGRISAGVCQGMAGMHL